MKAGPHTIPDYYSPIWTDMSSDLRVHVIHLNRKMIMCPYVLHAPLSLLPPLLFSPLSFLSSSLSLSPYSFPPFSPASIPSLLSSTPPPFPSPSLPLSLPPSLRSVASIPPLPPLLPLFLPPSPSPSFLPHSLAPTPLPALPPSLLPSLPPLPFRPSLPPPLAQADQLLRRQISWPRRTSNCN